MKAQRAVQKLLKNQSDYSIDQVLCSGSQPVAMPGVEKSEIYAKTLELCKAFKGDKTNTKDTAQQSSIEIEQSICNRSKRRLKALLEKQKSLLKDPFSNSLAEDDQELFERILSEEITEMKPKIDKRAIKEAATDLLGEKFGAGVDSQHKAQVKTL